MNTVTKHNNNNNKSATMEIITYTPRTTSPDNCEYEWVVPANKLK